jgi:preprotein translocase subunit SecG
MKWFVVVVFLVFMLALGIVVRDAIRHANKTSHDNRAKPAR